MKYENQPLETKFETAESHEMAAVEGGYMFMAGMAVGAWAAVGAAAIAQHYANRRRLGDVAANVIADAT